jgi:hypothetical protein
LHPLKNLCVRKVAANLLSYANQGLKRLNSLIRKQN